MKRTTDAFLRGKPRSRLPHEFVLDVLEPVSPVTKPMFGCLAVYVRDRIVLILRDRPDQPADNGVWLATREEDHVSLKREFPNMRSIRMFGTPKTSWQVLPADASDFEESAVHACELVLARDPRIGRIPAPRRSAAARKKRTSPRTTARTARSRR
jgi:hypothetical protein